MAVNKEKMIEEIGNMSVLELAELVKDLEEKFGVSAQAAVVAAPAAASAGPAEAEEKSEYKVELTAAGPERIKDIKALRSVTSLGLSEAKKAVEDAPTVIAEAASKDEANKIKEALEATGAKVTLS